MHPPTATVCRLHCPPPQIPPVYTEEYGAPQNFAPGSSSLCRYGMTDMGGLPLMRCSGVKPGDDDGGNEPSLQETNELQSKQITDLKRKLEESTKLVERRTKALNNLVQDYDQLSNTVVDLKRQLRERNIDRQGTAASRVDDEGKFVLNEVDNWRCIADRMKGHFKKSCGLYDQETFYENRDSPNAYGKRNYSDYLEAFINKYHEEVVKQLDRFNGKFRSTATTKEKLFDLYGDDFECFNHLFEGSSGKEYLSKEYYRNMALQIFWSFFVKISMDRERNDELERLVGNLQTSLQDCREMKRGLQYILEYPEYVDNKTKAVCEYNDRYDRVDIFCYWNGNALKLNLKLPDIVEDDYSGIKERIKRYVTDNLTKHKEWPQIFEFYIVFTPHR